MDVGERIRITEALVTHVRNGTSDLADAEHFNPVAEYVDPGHAEVERERLFRTQPLVVGHAGEIPEPGQFVTVDVAGLPLVVIRQDDGSVAAFLNVCRHRGAKVVEAACGHGHAFTCPYHAWTYGRDGALLAIPDDVGFPSVDRADRSLVRLPAEQRHGLLWVVPTPGADIDVAAHLGPVDAELAAFGLGDHVEERVEHLDVDFNWKLVVDGFLELYHLPFLHAATIGPYIMAKPVVFDRFGNHGRMIGVRRGFAELAAGEPADIDLLANSVIVYQLFPNTQVVWQLDHFEVWTAFPGADPGRSWTRASLLAPPDQSGRTDHWDKNWKILMDTVSQEDFRVSQGMHAGFGSGAQEELVFGRNEPALQHFHQTLAREVDATVQPIG